MKDRTLEQLFHKVRNNIEELYKERSASMQLHDIDRVKHINEFDDLYAETLKLEARIEKTIQEIEERYQKHG